MLVFKKTFPKVHDKIDEYQPLLQSNHRLLNHNEITIEEIRMTMGEEEAVSALLHIMLDEVADKVGKEKSIATLIEILNNG